MNMSFIVKHSNYNTTLNSKFYLRVEFLRHISLKK